LEQGIQDRGVGAGYQAWDIFIQYYAGFQYRGETDGFKYEVGPRVISPIMVLAAERLARSTNNHDVESSLSQVTPKLCGFHGPDILFVQNYLLVIGPICSACGRIVVNGCHNFVSTRLEP